MDENKEEKNQEENKPLYPYIIFLLLVFLMMILSFYFWTALNSSHIPSLSYAGGEEKSKEDEIEEGYKIYKNHSADFQFIYPQTWALSEGHNSIVISSDKDYPEAYIGAQNPPLKDTDIYIQIHFSNLPVDISREIPNYTKASWSKLTIDGISAKKISYIGTEKFAELIPNFLLGDFYFTISVDSMNSNKALIAEYNKLISSFGQIDEKKEGKNE